MPALNKKGDWVRNPICVLLALVFIALEFSPVLAGDDFRSGVNRMNLAWRSPAEQQEILGKIAASGVTDVRLSLSRPVDKSIQAVKIASLLGLNILLEIQLSNKSYYRPGLQPRTGHDRIWDIHRLSDLDLQLYRSELVDAFTQIDEAGIRLSAVQPGNEINISPYNGDLRVFPARRVHTARSVEELTNRTAFERGLDNYVEALRVTRQVLDTTVHSREAKLVTAGLSDMRPKTADGLGYERLDAAEVIELLRERGIDAIVDAYGIHIYPGNRIGAILAARVNDLLDFCGSGEIARPCWVTEWGIANKNQKCPVNDSKRETVFQAMRETFADLSETGQLEAVYYYDWDTHERYSIWRCGELSPAGAVALGVGGHSRNAAHSRMPVNQ